MNLSLIPVAMAAQSSAAANQMEGTFSTIIFLFGFILIFYFMLWRPQNKRAKEHQQLMASLKKDDEVVTSGGILGCITKVSDHFIEIEIADQVKIAVQKQAISSVVPKGTRKAI